MKKLFTMVSLCLFSVMSTMAGTTTIYERGTTAETAWSASDIAATGNYVWGGNAEVTTKNYPYVSGNGGRVSNMTIAKQEGSILTYDAVWFIGADGNNATNYTYFRITDKIEFQAHTTNQVGNVVINGTSYTVSNACGKNNGNRTDDEWTIHVEINTASNTVTALTVAGKKGTKKASYTLSSETSLGTVDYSKVTFGTYREKYSPYCGVISMKIQETTQEVTTADYTINYIFEEQNKLADSGNTIVGKTVNADSPITIDGQKYYATSSPLSMTIDENATKNVLNVELRKAEVYNWTAKSNLNTILGSGTYIEGEANVGINVPRFILSNGTLYETTGGYWKTFAVTQNNHEEIFTYNAVANNIVAYSEVENISGAASISFAASVASLGAIGRTTYSARPTIVNLPAGEYKLYTLAHAGNGQNTDTYNATFYKGDDLFDTFSFKGRTNSQGYSTTFSLDEATDIKFECPTGNSTGLDYIYIQQTAVPVTISSVGYATFVPSYAVDFTDNAIEAYAVSAVNANTVTLKKVTQVPAGEAVIVKGESGNVNVIASAEAIDNELKVATKAIAYDENADNINYVLAQVDGNVGLYPVNSGTIAAGKGYLPVANNNAAKGGFTFVTDDVTAANVVKAAPAAVKNGKFATAEGIVIVKDGVKYNVAGMKK